MITSIANKVRIVELFDGIYIEAFNTTEGKVLIDIDAIDYIEEINDMNTAVHISAIEKPVIIEVNYNDLLEMLTEESNRQKEREEDELEW